MLYFVTASSIDEWRTSKTVLDMHLMHRIDSFRLFIGKFPFQLSEGIPYSPPNTDVPFHLTTSPPYSP